MWKGHQFPPNQPWWGAPHPDVRSYLPWPRHPMTLMPGMMTTMRASLVMMKILKYVSIYCIIFVPSKIMKIVMMSVRSNIHCQLKHWFQLLINHSDVSSTLKSSYSWNVMAFLVDYCSKLALIYYVDLQFHENVNMIRPYLSYLVSICINSTSMNDFVEYLSFGNICIAIFMRCYY